MVQNDSGRSMTYLMCSLSDKGTLNLDPWSQTCICSSVL